MTNSPERNRRVCGRVTRNENNRSVQCLTSVTVWASGRVGTLLTLSWVTVVNFVIFNFSYVLLRPFTGKLLGAFAHSALIIVILPVCAKHPFCFWLACGKLLFDFNFV